MIGRRNVEILGYHGTTYNVSEGRIELISKILGDVQAEVAKYENQLKIPRKVLGKLRKMQIDAMVEFSVPVPDDVYESKDFPISVLNDLQSFFLMNAKPL
jgi:hypothetical protein